MEPDQLGVGAAASGAGEGHAAAGGGGHNGAIMDTIVYRVKYDTKTDVIESLCRPCLI